MRHTLTLIKILLLAGWLTSPSTAQPIHQRSLGQLEERLANIDSERSQLAYLTLRSGVGSLGWQSQLHSEADHTEWARIDFSQPQTIEQVTLVPILWRNTQTGIQADGFPTRFQVVAGDSEESTGTVLASFDDPSELLPRTAPLVIPLPPTTAKWIRVEASELSPRALDGKFLFQLSEILAFSGEDNVALHQSVTVSSSEKRRVQRSIPAKTLVDGVTPYLINSPQLPGSTAYVAFYHTGPQASLTLDLKKSVPINRIHLHAADLSENIPQVHHSDYGIPKHLIIEGSTRPDFADPIPLVEYERDTIYDGGPTLAWRFPETNCRYIRITAIDGYKAPEAQERWRCIGFAEIEVFSGGANVALGTPVHLNLQPPSQEGSLASLTDGRNHFGTILPVREWMEQLARRHDLERERPLVEAERDKRYARQKTMLRIMSWIAAALAVAIVISMLLNRIFHLRRTAQLKERFAADLHDELGADLHTIGLLSDLAQSSRDDPQKLDTYLQQIRSATEETGTAVRHLADMQSATPYPNLETTMKQIANRVVVHLQHELSIQGEDQFDQLPAGARSDLILFYKECLINICRHSEATKLRTTLAAKGRTIHLAISDNGQGITDNDSTQVPKSLQRRAKLLGGKVTVETSAITGTTIHLKLRQRRFGIR
ncbi:histidine kinase [Pelagicoccus sp. SDUM812005]|uniref:histidine kinase n=1 Tax=Pelagicoccus sp. SDUM812005 TaxID=3041257 RepID=UPI00280E231D|nr:histidine kinase [Pelagicoccus sp. SDUM812005]MDQ8182947.1 histidine kinase [Pelagicoccus sp. SDUM812005]